MLICMGFAGRLCLGLDCLQGWDNVSLRKMICVGYKSRFQTGREEGRKEERKKRRKSAGREQRRKDERKLVG